MPQVAIPTHLQYSAPDPKKFKCIQHVFNFPILYHVSDCYSDVFKTLTSLSINLSHHVCPRSTGPVKVVNLPLVIVPLIGSRKTMNEPGTASVLTFVRAFRLVNASMVAV
jgi:hypothetical protein